MKGIYQQIQEAHVSEYPILFNLEDVISGMFFKRVPSNRPIKMIVYSRKSLNYIKLLVKNKQFVNRLKRKYE